MQKHTISYKDANECCDLMAHCMAIDWSRYLDLVAKAELADYGPVRGELPLP